MSRRASPIWWTALVAAVVVAMLLAVGVRAQSTTIPRCDQDMTSSEAEIGTTSLGLLSYQHLTFCQTDDDATLEVVKEPAPPNTVFTLDGWTYAVGINSIEPAVFILNALCGTTVVCQAELTHAVPYVPHSSSHTNGSDSSNGTAASSYPTCSHAANTVAYKPGATYQQALPFDATNSECVYTAEVDQPSTGTVSMTRLPLQYTFTSSASSTGSTSFVYRVACNGKIVCQSTRTITFDANSTVPAVYPVCSHTNSTFTVTSGTASNGTFAMDLQEGDCIYSATITQPPLFGNITPTTTGLGYTYTAPSGVVASSSSTVVYTIQCNGATMCQDAMWVTVVPAPEPTYPQCSQSSKTVNFAVSSTQTRSFPMDVQVTSCNYTTRISAWPSVGLIVPDSRGLGYLYVVPSTAVAGTITHVSYAVQCGGNVICKDQLTVRVTPEVAPAYPVCYHGNKQRCYPVGETSSDSFPMEVQVTSCAYTTSISVGPAFGTLTPNASGLSYTYAVPSTATVGATTTMGYRVACDGSIVCADTVTVVLAPASPTTSTTLAPATSTTTTAAPTPEVLPACSHSAQVRTYRIGELYVDTLPLDVQDTTCAYTATISDLSVGAAATMDDSNPLGYVYQTQLNVVPQDTSMNYTIACDGTNICGGAVAIHLTADADACPNKAASYVIRPSNAMSGTVNSGLVCDSGATLTATLRSSVTGMTLNPDGTFSFQAPSSEMDVLATVYMRCDGVVTCQTNVVFVVASKTVAPATTTTTTVAPITVCAKSFTYDVPTGQSLSGRLDPVPATSCNITTYLVSNSSSDVSGRLRVNLLGQFYYTAPNVQKVDYAAVDVYCAKAFVCRTQLAFAAYTPLPSANPTTSPLAPCANVYYYEAAPGVAIKTSLSNMPGQDICAHGRYFTLNTAPQSGTIEMTPIGDFIYRPPTQEGQFQFTFTMYCLNKQYCSGTAYLLVSNQWTLSPGSTPTPTGPNRPVVITNPQITCQGTCNANAWKTYPTPRVWDNTPGAGYARKDGRPVDGISVTWRNNSLVFLVYGLIGNLGVRFPTFEALTSTKGAFMESQDFAGTVATTSTGFEMSCLNNQGRAGLGEDVWKWMSLSYGSGTGSVGAYYRSGSSWYQKFGGKHIGCDTFVDPCHYAPLLTPANYTNSSLGRWSIDVNDCDATWTGVFPYNSLEKMLKHDGTQVWSFVADRQVQGTLYSEAVQASSWLAPGQFEANYDTHDILISLNQFVAVTKIGLQESLVSVDAEFFTYVDAATGDQAFGINMLVYPFVDATMTSSYARDRHVVGFKWVQQEWMSPDAEQCPTCTGTKMKCVVPLEGMEPTFTGDFPEGDCGNGRGRVHLFKGPSMTVDDCAPNKMHVYNRSGFSATRNCKATYQNVTLRGIVPGSRNLSTVLKHAFNYEGAIQLVLRMEDGSLERLSMHLSMYVSRLSKDASRVDGALNACRSGSYWPVLDPLGTSTAANPFDLSVSDATPLCIDDLSSSYGPSDWALFTMNMPGVKLSEVTVRSVYVLLNNTRVYLIYKDTATGAATIPDAANGEWWQYKYPFFAFRDLSAYVLNNSITFSKQMANSAVASDIVYAFTFIPGSLGVDTDIELVVEAVIQQAGSPASSTEFRRVLHVDPLLTLLSRQGPPTPVTPSSREDAKRDLYAIGATAGVAVALVVTVIFFMLADNNRPLPKWVPRGKLIKETVLSVIPAGMRGKKKPKRIVHKDMYDAMNSGRY